MRAIIHTMAEDGPEVRVELIPESNIDRDRLLIMKSVFQMDGVMIALSSQVWDDDVMTAGAGPGIVMDS